MTEQDLNYIKDTLTYLIENNKDENPEHSFNIAYNSIKILEKAINYTHCCKSDSELLKELKEPTLDEWLKANFIPLGNSGFTNRNEDTVWTKIKLTEIHAILHL